MGNEVGMIEMGDDERFECRWLGWFPPSLSGVGDGERYDLVPTGFLNGALIESNPLAQALVLDLLYACDTDVRSYQITTGGFGGVVADMIAELEEEGLDTSELAGPHSRQWSCFARLPRMSVAVEFGFGIERYPNGRSSEDWYTGGSCTLLITVEDYEGGDPRGYRTTFVEEHYYYGALDIPGKTASAQAEVGANANQTYTYTFGPTSLVQQANFPLDVRLGGDFSGTPFATSDTSHGGSLADGWSELIYWEGYPRPY